MGQRSIGPNTHPVDYQPEEKLHSKQKQEGDTATEEKSARKTLVSCYPLDFYTLLYGLLTVTGLIVSIIDFFHTGNTSMLMALCYMAAGHTGLQKVNNLVKDHLTKRSQEV